MEKELYKMKLLEELYYKESEKFIRVPGGWLFVITTDGNRSATFIPLDYEYKTLFTTTIDKSIKIDSEC